MRKSWAADAVIGLFLTLLVAAGYMAPPLLPLFEGLELKSYDQRSKLRQNVDPSRDIVVIAIDDASISQVGRWPWPRARVAALLDKLAAIGPKVIGLDIVYSEAEQNQGLIEIQELERRYKELTAQKKLVDRGGAFGQLFSSAAVRLDSDTRLLASIKSAKTVVLPMFLAQGGLLGAKPEELPPAISSHVVQKRAVAHAEEPETPDGTKAVYPLVAFAEAAVGVGHVNVEPDFDGVVRRESPVLRYGEAYLPSFALKLALAYAGVAPQDVVFTPGEGVAAAGLRVPVDAAQQTLISFNGPDHTFQYYSFADVMNDKVDPGAFKDKIVLVGLTATGVGTLYVTPVAHNFPAVEIVANSIENILHGRYLTRPSWAANAELAAIALMGLFIVFVLPRLKALWGFVVSLLLLLGLAGGGTYLFIHGQWLKAAYPAALLSLGYLLIITRRFFTTEKGKELVEASAIETNKMLGLSFQGQGMLDLAFEKFRLCPLDANMKDTLYNLALDFERKRQFAKAAAVLDHIAAKDPKYKDVAERAKTLKAASEGAVFGGVGGAKKEGTVMIAGGASKPTLGRYEIEKELGRGAMGIVYLGRDPKINRQVAIKTMMLEEGSDSAEGKAARERFFREAESAGTLNHPNIVRIFDAGEEEDVAYIAMELLDGHDLTRYATKSGLLPVKTVLEYVATVADALDYAHAQGIVHRDVKPANVMLLKDGTIRVADFGIARITASSRTATGTVMGTPAYMSPEQVAGKKVDGRADIFSLGVVLFELLTGEKPFKGGEGIGTLLFQIANDPHPDPRTLNPAVSEAVVAVVNKALAKNPQARYARAAEMAADLRACLKGVPTATQPVAEVAAAQEGMRTITIEMPGRSGVGGSDDVPPPRVDPEATFRIESPQEKP